MNKQAVLNLFPGAPPYAAELSHGTWAIHKVNGAIIGLGKTPAAAWANARQRLA